MQWLVAYDISDDTRRQRLSKILLDYGQRVQESVFWIDAEDDLADRIRDRVAKAISPADDVIWILPLCGNCTRRVVTLGNTRVPELPEYYIL
jgi:CRISPR-associated protein Cas2